MVRTPEFKKQDIPASPGPPPPIVRQPAPIPEHPSAKPAPKGPAVARPQPAPKPQPVPEKKKEAAKSPQHQASMQLVNQAKGPLERGKPDTAIPMLEKAIQIDSQNPEAFLLLARAWKQKQARQKSLEFARKAELLYHGKPSKLKEVYQLEADLYREMGDSAKAAKYKKRASSVGEKPAKVKAGPAQ